MAFFISPALEGMGAAGGSFMQNVGSRTKLTQVMRIVPPLVILSGFRLLWVVSGGFDSVWLSSAHGITLTAGSLLGILAFVYGMIVMMPKSSRIAAIGKAVAANGGVPTPEQGAELAKIKAGMKQGGIVIAWIVGLTVILMSIARNVY